MCEFWVYGCGHAIRTPCPRPKPVTTVTCTSTTGSKGSTISTSTHSSPRRGSSNTTSTDLTPISKFCNGFPTVPQKTTAPCYNCILADAKLQVQLEKPEVEAKKEELRRGSMARTIVRGPDGRYVDEFGNKIIAEEEYEQEYVYGGRQGRDRGTFSSGRGNGSGNGMFAGNEYFRSGHGGQDRRHTAGGAFNAGNGGFRGGRGGGVPNGFGHHRDGYNNGNGGGYFQDGHGEQRGGNLSNQFGPRRNTYSNQQTGRHQGSSGSGYANGFGQQHFQNDFGGASWGQSGRLGHGLDGGLYHQDANHVNGRRF
jgi:hypothetical protein